MRSARGLAALAGVSLTSTVRFVGAFEGDGYLERTRRELRLVRIEELLHTWQAASRPWSEPIGARWLIAPRDVWSGVVQLHGALAKVGVEAAARASPSKIVAPRLDSARPGLDEERACGG